MRASLKVETERLVRSWTRHDQAMLRDYLVADVEDPRLNVQSLITRQFLIAQVAGGRFLELMDAELRFSVGMNWLLGLCKAGANPSDWAALAHGLKQSAGESDGWEIPDYIHAIHRQFPATADGVEVPDFLVLFLERTAAGADAAGLLSQTAGLFVGLWKQVLTQVPRPEALLRVLEVACGSANDYRSLAACGLDRLLDYTGIDLCPKNVENASVMFPGARFEVGNAFEIQSADRAWDCLLVHDLFEHLSPEGLEVALGEVCRVTSRSLVLGFFNMDEIEDHVLRPLEDYHWNTLAVDRVREVLARHRFLGQAVNVGTFLRWAVSGATTHNANAYTLLMERLEPIAE